jgi:hypothetical protein
VVTEAWDRTGHNGELLSVNAITSRALDLLEPPTASNFKELFAGEGTKSQWGTWDPVVYARVACRAFTILNGEFFHWRDLHWNLDTR